MRCSILPFLGLICSACVENYDADPTTTVDTGTSSQDTPPMERIRLKRMIQEKDRKVETPL